jgi:hypothetical protein
MRYAQLSQRGKRSAAEIMTILGDFRTVRQPEPQFGPEPERPDPPRDLPARQQEIWREVVASEAADFFATASVRLMLQDFCAHQHSAERLTDVLGNFDPELLITDEGLRRHQQILKMRELETRAAANLATKMRLTNQSRYHAQKAAAISEQDGAGPKPWQS